MRPDDAALIIMWSVWGLAAVVVAIDLVVSRAKGRGGENG